MEDPHKIIMELSLVQCCIITVITYEHDLQWCNRVKTTFVVSVKKIQPPQTDFSGIKITRLTGYLDKSLEDG